MDTNQRRNLILKGNMYKVILTLALPIMLNNLIQTLYNLVDAMWISKLGSTEFAATSFVWPVNFLFTSLGIGIAIAGTSLLSQYIGASKYEEANKYVSQFVVISFIAAVFFSILGYFFTPTIVRIMGARGEVAHYGTVYLRLTFLDLPFTFFIFNYNAIMNSQGNTLMPTILGGISGILNAILDPIFIFTLNMGVGGAAIATIISKGLLALVGIILLMNSRGNIKLSFKRFRFDKNKIRRIIKIAIPSSVGQSGSAMGFMVLNVFIASYGTATMAAFGMVNKITSLVMQPSMGVGESLTSITGQNLGYGQIERVEEAFKKAMIITLTFSIIGSLLLFIYNTPIIYFFVKSRDDQQVIIESIEYLKYISLFMPLMGVFSILKGVFEGTGHTKYSMHMEIGRLWLVRLPMILLLKYFTTIDSRGIWFSMGISNLIICIYGYFVYRQAHWKKTIIQGSAS